MFFFSDLCKKTWSVYRCTPLHQFKQDRNSLKHYSRLLSASFVANKHKKMGIGLDEEEAPSTGVFSTADGLALQEGIICLHSVLLILAAQQASVWHIKCSFAK